MLMGYRKDAGPRWTAMGQILEAYLIKCIHIHAPESVVWRIRTHFIITLWDKKKVSHIQFRNWLN